MSKLMKNVFLFLFIIFSVLTTVGCEIPIYTRPSVDTDVEDNDPHVHLFVNGKCSCGEVDPNYVEPHQHNFVNGKCECGEIDPNFTIKDNYNLITIAEAIEIAKESGSTASDAYYVYGVIVSIENYQYGSMTIQDETGSIYVYGVYDKTGENRYDAMDPKPVVGDEVVLKGAFKTYNDTPEMDRGYLQEMHHEDIEIDVSEYKESSILEAREAKEEEKVKLTGVVAQITYANGMSPNGFYLVDNTGSIYVYGNEVTANVKEGNTVTIIGEKTYYVLETEQANADKFGYKGCCQIQNAQVVSNDKGNSGYDKSWISESTIKDIMETPVTENITTNIYKVNALVKKVPGSGFVNYYFDDLDGVTGSYTYTACNGSDFEWLDEFDGKICTVYLSPINCKSSASGCLYRFIPIEVIDEGYTFDLNDAPSYALKYHLVDQFLSKYEADPAIELITNVSSELLGFENVIVTYSTSNENVVYFEEVEGKVIFHVKDAGTATITITAVHNGNEKSETLEISVESPQTYETLSVLEAINTADDTEVIVKGIVLSSLVNKTGFYLIDDTGVIAVQTSSETVKGLKIGDEVVVKGTKDHKVSEGKSCAGQINIYNAEVLVNYYGNHEYSTELFDDTKDLAYLRSLDSTEDHSTEVYVVEGVIKFIDKTYYTVCQIETEDGSTYISLYCANSGQYSFLEPFKDQVVKLEIAMCNWNDKSYYTACIISATLNGEKIINQLNFDEKK